VRRLLLTAALVLGGVAFVVISGAATSGRGAGGTYRIELDNAFGLVDGSQVKVAGVPAGTIGSVRLDRRSLHAIVTVHVTQRGFGAFHADAFCQSRPQSLIGEYFVDCQPGQRGGVLPAGSTIPVSHTQSTIPADLLLNVMRLPYRQRLTLIVNELGAGVAARSGDLEAALRRAVPALTETDNLLALLAGDSRTLQQLTTRADTVVTALADNRRQVRRFVVEAARTASATAAQQRSLRATLGQLPAFLSQLRPAIAQLGAAAAANQPALAGLNAAAAQLNRLLVDLPAFSSAALPAIRSLGRASITGRAAVRAAAPTVGHLAAFARPTPDLARNLAIVLHDLDDRGRAVEADSRSPGGKGYTGLEALLQYVFNQTLAINTFGPFGHVLAVDAFVDPRCSPYATPATVALSLRQFGGGYRQCYSWLGPSQPGVNVTDPTNPRACVPDPGGAPPGERGPRTRACRLSPGAAAREDGATAAATRAAAAPPAARAAPAAAPPRAGPARQLLDYLLAP
jgi:virulence factor Mce-like protein